MVPVLTFEVQEHVHVHVPRNFIPVPDMAQIHAQLAAMRNNGWMMKRRKTCYAIMTQQSIGPIVLFKKEKAYKAKQVTESLITIQTALEKKSSNELRATQMV